MKEILKVKEGKKRAHPRLPNGFGSIVTLSGRRRRPYMARPPVTKFDENGYPVYDKPIGYFADWFEAFEALSKYNQSPYDTGARNMTFREVYEAWFREKYELNKNKTYSQSSINCSRAAFKNSALLHDRVFSKLNATHFQSILDNCTLSHASIEHIQNLFKQMSKYALKYDIIEKDYAALTTINQADDDEAGVPFSPDEIRILWDNLDKPFVDTILILIYSGYRIGAMKKLEVNLDEMYFRGGVKTRASKNRIVPIHSCIQGLVKARVASKEGFWPLSCNLYRQGFKKCLEGLNIGPHTPHDCRHTFATLLSSAKADPLVIKLLMGHSLGGDITEDKYIHKSIFELREELEKVKACH